MWFRRYREQTRKAQKATCKESLSWLQPPVNLRFGWRLGAELLCSIFCMLIGLLFTSASAGSQTNLWGKCWKTITVYWNGHTSTAYCNTLHNLLGVTTFTGTHMTKILTRPTNRTTSAFLEEHLRWKFTIKPKARLLQRKHCDQVVGLNSQHIMLTQYGCQSKIEIFVTAAINCSLFLKINI